SKLKGSVASHICRINLMPSVSRSILSSHFGQFPFQKGRSFNASPVPTPSCTRPGYMLSNVAAACAMMAGWYRAPVGTVTQGPTLIRFVFSNATLIMDQAKEDLLPE